MKLFKRRLTEPVQDGVEPGLEYPVYDYEAEEEFVKAGDFEAWARYVVSRPWDYGLPKYSHIARQVARIEIEKARKEGMF